MDIRITRPVFILKLNIDKENEEVSVRNRQPFYFPLFNQILQKSFVLNFIFDFLFQCLPRSQAINNLILSDHDEAANYNLNFLSKKFGYNFSEKTEILINLFLFYREGL